MRFYLSRLSRFTGVRQDIGRYNFVAGVRWGPSQPLARLRFRTREYPDAGARREFVLTFYTRLIRAVM